MLRTEILINGTSIDLYDEVSIPMTYSILDIREPEKREGAFSKTITIPGTHSNNALFSHIWNVGTVLNTSGTTTQFSPNFNPNLKASAIVLIDGQNVLSGAVQLLNVNINEYLEYKVEYEVCIYADINDLMTAVGDKMLSQLDLSEYDHVYNKTNQVNSWNTSIIKNGANYVNFSGGQPIGEGYVYPMIDYGFNNGTSYNVTEFFPAIYAKTIFDKICNSNGFQIAGQFDYSDYFKHLIVPFGGANLRLSNTQVQNRTFLASNNSQTYFGHDPASVGPYSYTGIESFQDDSTGSNYDPGNVYNNSTFKFTAANAGTYKINATLILSLTHFPKNATVTYGSTDRYNQVSQIQIVKNNTTQVNTVNIGMLQGPNSQPNSNSQYWYTFKQTTLTSGTTNCNVTVPISAQVFLNAGDVIYINYISLYDALSGYSDLYGQTGTNRGYTRVNLNTGSLFTVTLADTKVMEGDTVSMNNVLPNNVKQKDFILSIIKAHNLYVLSDKTVKNKLIIDDRNSFYSSGTTRDWTSKLDYSKPRKIIPMGELDARDYLFTYKEDSDYYNDRYTKKWNEIYARARHSINNDFLKDEVTTELIFSPTPLADYISGIDRIISQIYSVDSQGIAQPKTSNLRLLYYGGVFSTNNSWNYVATSGTTSYSTYPYAGMVDNPTNPTVSLDFDSPHEVFYTTLSYTDNNLFNKYWKQALYEMTDPDSKIFEGWFKLNPYDIANIDFRDQFYFEGQLWILNKIYDYDPTINEVTRCEFIRLKQYAPYTSETKTSYGGQGSTFNSGTQVPMSSQRTMSNNNAINGGSHIGSGNFIAQNTIGCSIVGSMGSSISEGCSYVNFINTSGVTAMAGVQNATIINTSGVTISENNVVYINGVKQQNYADSNDYVYTPTITNESNVTASTAYPCQYMRVGNVVTVSGRVDIDVTGVGDYSILMTLPIPSNFTNDYQCSGSGMGTSAGINDPLVIWGDTSKQMAKLKGNDNDLTNHSHFFHFTYRIV